MTTARIALMAFIGLFFAWAGIWIFLLPALLVNDADNGRLGYDWSRIWLPELGLAAAGVVYCIVVLAGGGARPRAWTLIPPAGLAVAVTIFTLVVAPFVSSTGPGRG